MAKRFTDSGKWKKSFFRNLPAHLKLFWIYLLDECNHAGIWEVEIDVASIRTGVELDGLEATALEAFGDRVVPIDGGTKWFIPDFIGFQYSQLNEKNRAHKSVLDILQAYDLLIYIEPKEAPCKPLASPLEGAMVKDKDKDKDKDTEKDEPHTSKSPKRKKKSVRDDPPSKEQFSDYCRAKGFGHIADRAFEYYSELDWSDAAGNEIKSWKAKLQSVWFDEKKNPPPPEPEDKFGEYYISPAEEADIMALERQIEAEELAAAEGAQ